MGETDENFPTVATEAAVLIIARMQTRELERMLLVIASRVTDDQWVEIAGDVGPHGLALMARLHALKAAANTAASGSAEEHGVITTGAACVSRRDEKLMDRARHWASKDVCQSCRCTCRHGCEPRWWSPLL